MAEAASGNRSGGAGIDPVATALMAMPGYSLTEYEAESADFEVQERILILKGPGCRPCAGHSGRPTDRSGHLDHLR